MIFLSVALQKVKTLYIDPKRELRHHYLEVINSAEFERLYPERKKQLESFNFVTLDSSIPSNHGVLDPIVVLDKEQAVEVAKHMLEFLLQAVDDVSIEPKTAITEAINAIVDKRHQGEMIGFKQVIERLKDDPSPGIASVGRYLSSIISNSILELAFSDGHIKGLDYDAKVTILEVTNLKLPKDDTTGFGTIFAFYEKSEREAILKHVNLDVNPENLEWIDNMISGQCLYYDVYGNLNLISIHNIFQDIDQLLKPMKATVSSSLENKYAS